MRSPRRATVCCFKGVVADGDLPVIRMDAAPVGERVENTNTKDRLDARRHCARRDPPAGIDRLWTGPRGMMLALVDGPDLIFGDALRRPPEVAER